MAFVLHDYTVQDVDNYSTAERDFELEHDEKRICIEIPVNKAKTILRHSDGVLIADGHEVELQDYLYFVARAGSDALALLRVRGSMTGTGIRGMKRKHIKKLLQKLGLGKSAIKNFNDPAIQAKYFPTQEA